MRIIVCDAGPIIHLHEAGMLSLLAQMGDIFLPQGVSVEMLDVVNLANAWPEWLQLVDLDSSELREAES